MNRHKLIADFRRSWFKMDLQGREIQMETFSAIAQGDDRTAANGALMLAHYARPMIRKAERRDAARAKHEALTSLGLKRAKGALGGTYYE